MKGVLMGGGLGTRLYPVTFSVSKHLLPIYNKPMIYYSLSLLMLAGIRDIAIVTDKKDLDSYKRLFGDGSRLGLKISYFIQDNPTGGIAEGIKITREFIGADSVMLVLGDNVLYGNDLINFLNRARKEVEKNGGAVIFGYYVNDPKRYGVIEFDKDGNVISIEEKPENPKSNYAVPGIYFYDNDVINIVEKLKPSSRGQLEITDVNKEYLKKRKLKVILLGRGFAWLDTGTFDSLVDASIFVKTVEERTGLMIGNIEEIAWRNGWIDTKTLYEFAEKIRKTNYGKYLISLISQDEPH